MRKDTKFCFIRGDVMAHKKICSGIIAEHIKGGQNVFCEVIYIIDDMI